MARYDHGLRGPGFTTGFQHDRPMTGPYDLVYRRRAYDRGFRSFDRPPRVTASYNMDYVRERGPGRPRNPNPYGGAWRGQIGGEGSYQHPYLTRGGTWTSRGAPPPLPYDYRDFGPEYGGRYRDEF